MTHVRPHLASLFGQSGCGCASVFLGVQGGGKINMNIKVLDVGLKNDTFKNLPGFMVFKHANVIHSIY